MSIKRNNLFGTIEFVSNKEKEIKEIKKAIDRVGIIVGFLNYYKNGDIIAKDRYGNFLGVYIDKDYRTYDIYNNEYCHGNGLMDIIYNQ